MKICYSSEFSSGARGKNVPASRPVRHSGKTLIDPYLGQQASERVAPESKVVEEFIMNTFVKRLVS